MQIVNIDINKIKPYEKNPRINEGSIHYVMESIKKFGFKVPLTVDKDYVIITGHTRYEACKKLGFKEVPCIIVDDLDENKIRAFRLADNKVAEKALWDYDKLKEELQSIENIDMNSFGFDMVLDDIDWDNVEDLEEDLYEEPEGKMVECPYCNHIDTKWRFNKVNVE